jgi:hypothetical protein
MPRNVPLLKELGGKICQAWQDDSVELPTKAVAMKLVSSSVRASDVMESSALLKATLRAVGPKVPATAIVIAARNYNTQKSGYEEAWFT